MTEFWGLATGLVTLLIAILGLLAWVAKNQNQITRPNGGSSIYDIVIRIEKRIDRLETLQDDHLALHIDQRSKNVG